MQSTNPVYYGPGPSISPFDIYLDQVNSAITAYRKVYLLQPCHSGGMIGTMHMTGTPDPNPDNPPDCLVRDWPPGTDWTDWWAVDGVGAPALSNARTVILASVRWDESNNWPWMETLAEALFSCDDTGDAVCSYEEAFRMAWDAVPADQEEDQHPPLDDNADGVGHSPDEAPYQPDTAGQDGYLARRSYL